jgi:hypothetical protein
MSRGLCSTVWLKGCPHRASVGGDSMSSTPAARCGGEEGHPMPVLTPRLSSNMRRVQVPSPKFICSVYCGAGGASASLVS